MSTHVLKLVRHRGLEAAFVGCVALLGWLVFSIRTVEESGVVRSQRNRDFPETYIGRIHLDLTSPNHYVRLSWKGPEAANQATGPFRSSPGRGWGNNNCNDPIESNCPNSNCTPKGLRTVEGFQDYMVEHAYRYVTFIDRRRAIAFHSHPAIPHYPASQGCVRLEPYAARLIHDNSLIGKTEILIDGTWTNPDNERTNEVTAKQGS